MQPGSSLKNDNNRQEIVIENLTSAPANFCMLYAFRKRTGRWRWQSFKHYSLISTAAQYKTAIGGNMDAYILPVINRSEISGDRKAFKWLSIEYFLDYSTH
jgi:hypothetical protein